MSKSIVAKLEEIKRLLKDIAEWNLPEQFEFNYGSNGAREYIRKLAKQALQELE